MTTDANNQPPLGLMGGSVHAYERALDPFHADAAPDEFKEHFKQGERKAGWMAIDGFGNAIGFIPDGTQIK